MILASLRRIPRLGWLVGTVAVAAAPGPGAAAPAPVPPPAACAGGALEQSLVADTASDFDYPVLIFGEIHIHMRLRSTLVLHATPQTLTIDVEHKLREIEPEGAKDRTRTALHRMSGKRELVLLDDAERAKLPATWRAAPCTVAFASELRFRSAAGDRATMTFEPALPLLSLGAQGDYRKDIGDGLSWSHIKARVVESDLPKLEAGEEVEGSVAIAPVAAEHAGNLAYRVESAFGDELPLPSQTFVIDPASRAVTAIEVASPKTAQVPMRARFVPLTSH